MARRAAIAFDIDGVFKYGREWSEHGLDALKRASAAGISYVFVTNGGGGLTEGTYGSHLKEKVLEAGGGQSGDIALPSAERMVLSYTPWHTQLAPELADKRVMLVGDPKEKVLNVAAQYGLKHVTHYTDYAITHKHVNPFRAAKESGKSHTAVDNATAKTGPPFTGAAAAPGAAAPAAAHNVAAGDEVPFAAVLVMCDPYEWYEALQVSIDVLCSPTPLTLQFDAQAPAMPIHFSNPDFLSKFEHPFPRFAQGAFKTALLALYRARLRALRVPDELIDERVRRRAQLRRNSARNSCAILAQFLRNSPTRRPVASQVGASFKQWGKPTDATYRFVEKRLRELAGSSEPAAEEVFYMVGDNPTSDMEGARRANIHHRGTGTTWKGVLVRTGVYKEGDETNSAAVVVDGVREAVDWILAQEAAADGPAAKKAKK